MLACGLWAVCLCLLSAAVTAQSGDSKVNGLLSRAAVYNADFASQPTTATNWQWAAQDPTDTSANAAVHQGVAILNGSATSYIDITAATGPQSAGAGLSIFGGTGYNGSGYSIEMVFKVPTLAQNLGSTLLLLQDASGDYLTLSWDNTYYDENDVDSGNRMVARNVNAGVPQNATQGYLEFLTPSNATWYHVVWALAPSGNNGSGVWTIYVNGQLLNWANALVPSSTLTPIQGANYPLASNRTLMVLGKDSFTNNFIATVDAFRIYDYLLPANAASALAGAYGLNIPTTTPTSYPYSTNAETSSLNALVTRAPVFAAVFAQNPTANPAIPFTNYQWAASDPTDSAQMATLHPGVVILNGSASSYINLQLASGPQSCGLVLPIIGGTGSGSGSSLGLSFEVAFKYPLATGLEQSGKIWDLGQGGSETIDMSAQSSGSLQLESQNNVAPGLELNNGYADIYSPANGFIAGVWHHAIWVLSAPNFNNYTAVWTLYVNGTQSSLIGPAGAPNFPLPVYRPLSYIGGSDYSNANLPLVLDAFRIYDYALTQAQATSIYNTLYNPGAAVQGPTSSTGAAGGGGVPASCQRVTGTTGGDFLLPTLPRAAVLNLNFTSSPSCVTGIASNWQWAASDPTDTSANAALHQGVAILNGNATSYIDLTTASGPQTGGAVLPSFGGAGFSGTGWSIELVMKVPAVTQNLGSTLLLLQDANGDYLTLSWDNTYYDENEVDAGNRMVARNVNAGVPQNATQGYLEFFSPVPNTWYHVVWTMAPSGSNGSAVWSIYINGQLLNWANALVPSSTLTPIQGANYPVASARNLMNLGKDSYTNNFIVTVDALRVYDYLLTSTQVGQLAGAYGLNIPTTTPTSYPYSTNAETSSLNALVTRAPVFAAVFAQNPTANPAIPFTNYQWAASDPTDSAQMATLHPGVVILNGSASSYINLQLASGPQSCGLVLPIIGGTGSGSGSSLGLSFEVAFKYPLATGLEQSGKIWDLGQGGSETIDMSAQSSGSLQLESQNNVAPGLELNNGYADIYSPANGFIAGVWHHAIWVLSAPNFNNYTAVWTLYVNGTQSSLIGPAGAPNFPLPVYRPLSYIGGSDYSNANLPLVLDAFRIYDYALTQAQATSIYNTLYNPGAAVQGPTSSTGAAGGGGVPASCQRVTGTTGGDFLLPTLPRAAVLNLNFTSSPSCVTGIASNWQWAASDPTDTSANAALHQGVAILNGNATSYIDLTTASGPQTGGAVLPSFGGAGFSGTGWSIELVMKVPAVTQNLGSTLLLLQDANGDYLTLSWDNTYYDENEVDAGNRMVARNVNAGVPQNATQGYLEFFSPVPNTWYHVVWTMAPSGSNGSAVWSIYINGQLLNWANALVPSSTLTPIQGANYPVASARNLMNLGKDSYTNNFIVTVDALRVYDYLLTSTQVGQLAGAYGLNIPTTTPTSYPYSTNAETSSLNALVTRAPVFAAVFAQNPTANPAIPFTNYQWAASDPTDSAQMATLHPGVVILNGSASSYINLQLASGPQSCGLVLPIIGGTGSGSGSSLGLSFEVAFKYPLATGLEQSGKIWDLGQGGSETIDMSAQSSGSLQLESQNNVAPGLELNNGYADIYSPANGFIAGVWHHAIWVLSAPNFNNYTATWTLYLNGTLTSHRSALRAHPTSRCPSTGRCRTSAARTTPTPTCRWCWTRSASTTMR